MTPRDKGPSGLVVAGRDVDNVLLSIKIENILVRFRKHFFFLNLCHALFRYLVSSRKKSFKKHWKKGENGYYVANIVYLSTIFLAT